MKALDGVFSVICQYTKTMGGLHGDFLSLVHRDIARFLEETTNVHNQMQWQGRFTLVLTSFNVALTIAGGLIPKVPTTAHISEQNASKFLRNACKAAAQGCSGFNNFSNTYFQGNITELQAKCSLFKEVNVNNGQSSKAAMDQNVAQAQRAVQSILDSKAKGG
jgi:hypothetical protein